MWLMLSYYVKKDLGVLIKRVFKIYYGLERLWVFIFLVLLFIVVDILKVIIF